jgi:hypothetical protein
MQKRKLKLDKELSGLRPARTLNGAIVEIARQ